MPGTTSTQAPPIGDYAIIVSPEDNLAVVKELTAPGLEVALPDGLVVRVNEAARPGHLFPPRPTPAGEFVLQYGPPIGTSLGIGEGDYISHANMSDEGPVVRHLPEHLPHPAPHHLPPPARAALA